MFKIKCGVNLEQKMTKQEYEKAVDTLNAWAKAYYDEDEPLASDEGV